MSAEQFKNQAARLAEHLATTYGFKLKRSGALEAVAASLGFPDWNTLSATGARTHAVALPQTGVPTRYSRDDSTQQSPLMREAACAAAKNGQQVVYLSQAYDAGTVSALRVSVSGAAPQRDAGVREISAETYNPLEARTVGQVVEKLLMLLPYSPKNHSDVLRQHIRDTVSFGILTLVGTNRAINLESVIDACRSFERLDSCLRERCSEPIIKQWTTYTRPWLTEAPTPAHVEECFQRSLGGLWGRLHLVAGELRKLRAGLSAHVRDTPASGEQLLTKHQVLYLGRQETSEMLHGWFANCLTYDLVHQRAPKSDASTQLFLDGMYHGHSKQLALHLMHQPGVSVSECPVLSEVRMYEAAESLNLDPVPRDFWATPIHQHLLHQ